MTKARSPTGERAFAALGVDQCSAVRRVPV